MKSTTVKTRNFRKERKEMIERLASRFEKTPRYVNMVIAGTRTNEAIAEAYRKEALKNVSKMSSRKNHKAL